MTLDSETFDIHAETVFRGKPMRVMGRMRLEGASGQISIRYFLSDGEGAPVLLEQVAGDRYALLRPFPPAARPHTKGNTITVGVERYTLVGVRRLKVLEVLGQAPGSPAGAAMLVSGMFEGLMGTLMRELVLGSDQQVYYLVRPVATGEMLSAPAHAAAREAESRAAGAGAGDDD
jgi:hypothetical protein